MYALKGFLINSSKYHFRLKALVLTCPYMLKYNILIKSVLQLITSSLVYLGVNSKKVSFGMWEMRGKVLHYIFK